MRKLISLLTRTIQILSMITMATQEGAEQIKLLKMLMTTYPIINLSQISPI